MPEKAKNKNDKDDHEEMSFLDHIGDLRKRIILSIVGIVIGCIISGVFINQIMNFVLLLPAKQAHLNLQNLKPFGQPFLYFKMIFLVGIIIAIPYILYQLWKFIAPGLYEHERNWARKITFLTSLCFFCGVSFAFFVLIPTMLTFTSSFGSETIKNIIDINEYFSFLSMMLIASGLIFEMPMVSFVLTRVGIINARFMRKYWRHAMVVILILAAILTPTTDPISMMIFASPLIGLYEISILISKIVEKNKKKDE
jgi:sec-independent protein translocase protein TatC